MNVIVTIEKFRNYEVIKKNILQTRIHDGDTIRNIAAELGVSTSTVLRAGLFSRI
jgi:DNA-directed RNA polymerase specialized sigma subunit